MLVEVCANSLESALNAQKAGADRIELCSELAVGGITPSYGLLQKVKELITIPVHVLIRPRSGDFSYSNFEFEIMKRNIQLCSDLGFDGVVSGILKTDFTLDIDRTEALMHLARGLHFTFHRAFDWVKDPLRALHELEGLGVDTILSSGQQKSAILGIDLLTELSEKSSSCTLMPGSGITSDNVCLFKEKGFRAVHLSGTQFHKTLSEAPKVSMNSGSLLKDDSLAVTQVQSIRTVVEKVK
ncbi:copper homeostasis protein CutC [Maribacter sp. CXY002]|uniref:copper homeostasis protein CutC n=1 Tax=Maribacter luteocoastalis TaxID=3407671 RepID=UPI003B67BE25